MRELRLKYIINLVSDIGAKAKTDQQALTMAQKAVQEAFKNTELHIGAVERALLMMGRVGSKSAAEQANYLAKLALRYQDLRKAAEGASQAMQTAARLGAGLAAGVYAADRMTRAPMEYNLRLAHMANTAYADRNAAGRVSGKATLNAAITAAVRTGGGKRDDAADALDNLIASGAVNIDDAIKLLPMLMKGSTASGASANQLGSIALRGMQSFGIKLNQVPDVLNMAMAAGQAGGFELKDMAKWLPQAMAAGRMSGLSGMEGMRRIMASMQASVVTAGSKDEAGNNVVNLLAKINSQDTANDVKKHDKEMKKRGLEQLGVDLPSYLAAQREKGVNSLDAFIGLVDGIANKDKDYVALKKKLGTAKPGERAETLQAMTDILQGKAVGTVIQDRQALMALVAEMNGRGYVKDVMDKTRQNTSALGTSFDVISREAEFSRQQALNEAAIGAEKSFQRLEPAIKGVLDTSTSLAREFPGLTTGVILATGALTFFTTALGASGLIGLLTGKAGGAGGLVGTVGTLFGGGAAAGAVAAGASGGGAMGGLLGLIKRFPPLLLLNELFTTPDADIDLLRNADRMRQGYRGKGYNDPRLLDMTGPNTVSGEAQKAALVAAAGLGEGRLDVNVTVSDERVTATTSVGKPMNYLNINSGNTNPAGYN